METTIIGGVVKNMATEGTKAGASFMATQFNYLVRYKKMVYDLKMVVSKLSVHKADTEQSIEKAQGDDKNVTHGMKRWLSEVTELEEKVKKMVNDCEGKKGMLELGKQYKLGKDSDKLMVEADKLQKEWSTLTIFHSAVVPSFSVRPQKEFNDYVSMRGVLNEVIHALKDEKTCILGIYGMGGIGKTTLIDQIGRQVEGEKVFDVVIAVELSQNLGVSQIQDLIAEQLGKNFKANSVEQKSGELASALKRANSILIMLDNLWTEVDLRKIGIPFGENHNGCKVLLTSRNIEVCNQMRTDAQFPVNLLSEEESWDLFKSEAGEVVTITNIQSIALKVAWECAKLPLALAVVGRALRGKNERDTWDNALRRLRESNPKDLVNVEEKVFKCLELSYTHLNRDDWKLLFLLCSLFPEGYELSEDELTRIGIGEEIFGKFNNLEEARGNMHMLASKLIDSCLLLRTKKPKAAKMHDVVRDVAIYIASRRENGFFIESGSGTNELLGEEVFKQSKRISLVNSKISELPSNPTAPELSVLLVRKNKDLIKLPENFFKEMEMLTVLDLSDSSFVSLPSSLHYLKNLRVFSLNRCIKLGSISKISKLENLQVLSCQGCPVGVNLNEIGKLTKLKLLDLSNSRELNLPSKVLSNLRLLEELYLDTSNLNKTVLIEIASLKRMNSVKLCMKDVDLISRNVITVSSFEKLKNYILYSDPSTVSKARVYRKNLHIKGADRLAAWVKLLLREVEDLFLDNCFWNANPLLEFAGLETLNGFSNLKILRISNCQRIAYLIGTTAHSVLKDVFVQLEELYLTNMDNLNGISEGTLKELSFGNTRKVHITACKGMFSVMPYSLLIKMHHNLEELIVKDCEELRGVFYFLSHETSVVMFDRLKDLYLLDLPKLCDIFHDQVPKGSFGNLKDLHIQGCNELKYVFPASVITGFQRLEKLTVYDNANMEEIISDDGFILDENALPKLIELTLAYVPKLNHFYKVGMSIKFFSWPFLKNLKLGVCKGLKMLPIGSESAPELKKIDLMEQSDQNWYKGLEWDNATASERFETLGSVSQHGYR